MERIELKAAGCISGEITPPPDKSISHRAVMFASIAEGESVIRNILDAEDPRSTINAFRMLGIEISGSGAGGSALIIRGKGLYGLEEPFDVIDCGNSGTTIRLLSGILAGSPFFSVLTGDASLKQRPMARVIRPLKEMGAEISGRAGDRQPPLAIKGKLLSPVQHNLPIASAQVKSCLLLAGLYSGGATAVTEPYKSRDHTERMLGAIGAEIEVDGLTVRIKGGSALKAFDMTVPSDFSSAAFFIIAALVIPGSEAVIKNICINPTRTGLLEVIKDMGAGVEILNARTLFGEPVADIYCRSADSLKGISIGRERVPSIIDEFPILCVLATQAEGITEIRGAEELRVKESDRIRAMATELKKMGAELEEYPDGIAIKGRTVLRGSEVESHGDHRIAMSLAIAGLAAGGTAVINNASCVNISYPGFFRDLQRLGKS